MNLQTKSLKNDEYPPSEDTFFIAENIEDEKGNFALDVGSGSGYLTKLLSENFSFVVGTDINFDVNIKNYGVSEDIFQSLMHMISQSIRLKFISRKKKQITL